MRRRTTPRPAIYTSAKKRRAKTPRRNRRLIDSRVNCGASSRAPPAAAADSNPSSSSAFGTCVFASSSCNTVDPPSSAAVLGGGGLGRDSRLGGRGGAASLAGGGILSDIFALRRSLDEARRESGDGRGGGSSGRVSSGSEAVAAGLADGGASSMAHPMLVRPRSMDSGDRARGDDGDAAENGDRPAASMRAILAEISGEMSRLAVGQQNGGRGGGASHGSGGDHGGRHRERTDSGFVVLPAAESLSPFLRVNRRDGRAGGESVARRGISVVDARAATWADVGALRDESSLRGSAVAGAFESTSPPRSNPGTALARGGRRDGARARTSRDGRSDAHG